VQRAIETAVRALVERDSRLAEEVIDGDEGTNERYVAIERETLELIATQQPLATDLREILAISAISTDLERIGDHAKGIGRIVLRMTAPPPNAPIAQIEQLSDLVRGLLAEELQAFVMRDPVEARRVAARDDEVDRLYEMLYERLLAAMVESPDLVVEYDRLLWVCKSLERCGDHATNIGERIVFLTTGELVELND
jgi:phosphate transport system protein